MPLLDSFATGRIIDVAAAIMHADFASLQRYDVERNALQLVNHRGFHPKYAELLQWIYPHSGTSCAVSLGTRRRTVIPDIESCQHELARDLLRLCGIRAMHTTPLLDRQGNLLGMCSTHWRMPHAPDAESIALFDIWTKQTADFFTKNTEITILMEEAKAQMERSRKLTRDYGHLIQMLNSVGNA